MEIKLDYNIIKISQQGSDISDLSELPFPPSRGNKICYYSSQVPIWLSFKAETEGN